MENYKAIPQGYMTVGEIAKKMGVTVRTLQYYDKEGLLPPSSESEGGFRLYTDRDIIKLYQIQSMKYLGFSLDDIKNRLISLDTPAEVASALTEHAAEVRNKIESLSESLIAIEALKEEVVQMQSVDFKKYADIISSLQIKNDFYRFIKYMDDDLLGHLSNRFDKESSVVFSNNFSHLVNKVTQLQKNGVSPESEEAVTLAKSWWNLTMEFAGGDISLLPKLVDFFESMDGWSGKWDEKWKEKLLSASLYISPALGIHIMETYGYDPFQQETEAKKHD